MIDRTCIATSDKERNETKRMESINLEQLHRFVSPDIFQFLAAGSDSTEAELPHTTPTEAEPTIINQLEAEPTIINQLEAEPTIINQLEAEPTIINQLEAEPTIINQLEAEPTIINQLEAELDPTVANAGAGYIPSCRRVLT